MEEKKTKKTPKKNISEIAEIIKPNIQLTNKEKEQILAILEKLYKATKVTSIDADTKIREIQAMLERKLTTEEIKVIRRKYDDTGHQYPLEFRKSIQFSNTCIHHVIQLLKNL